MKLATKVVVAIFNKYPQGKYKPIRETPLKSAELEFRFAVSN